MGWDQSTQRQSVMDFLLDLMGIDPNQLLLEALQAKMAEKGLTYEQAPAEGREEGDGMYNSFTPDVIKLSDGRVFIETQTETTQGDDWGNDYYTFVEAGKTFTFTRNDYHYDGNDPHTTTEEMISRTYELPKPKVKMPRRKEAIDHTKKKEGEPSQEANLPGSVGGLYDASSHHPECNDITRCHPDCSFVPEEASEDISFDHKGKSFTREEIRESNTEFGGAIADFMKKQGIDNISFESGEGEDDGNV